MNFFLKKKFFLALHCLPCIMITVSKKKSGRHEIPLQEKPHIQVTETCASLAEMKTAKGPGGDQATVEMWQNITIQLKFQVTAHFDRYLAMPRHVNQPDTWRQVLMVALQERQLPRWLVRGFARELCHLNAEARTANADWTPEFDFSKGGETGGFDTPALAERAHAASLLSACGTVAQRENGLRHW